MDWSAIISELESMGFRQIDIGAACECRQSTISGLKLGRRRAGYELGTRLVTFLNQQRRKRSRAVKPHSARLALQPPVPVPQTDDKPRRKARSKP